MKIELGALSPDISKQLEDAGFEAVGISVDLLDRLANGITLVNLHGCITDRECERARQRLIKRIKIRPKILPEKIK